MTDRVVCDKRIVISIVSVIFLALCGLITGIIVISTKNNVATIEKIYISVQGANIVDQEFSLNILLDGQDLNKLDYTYANAFLINKENGEIRKLIVGRNNIKLTTIGEYDVKVAILDGGNQLHLATKAIEIHAQDEEVDVPARPTDSEPPKIVLQNSDYLTKCKVGIGMYLDIDATDNTTESASLYIRADATNASLRYDIKNNVYLVAKKLGEVVITIKAIDEAGNEATFNHALRAYLTMVEPNYGSWIEKTSLNTDSSVIFGRSQMFFSGAQSFEVEFVSKHPPLSDWSMLLEFANIDFGSHGSLSIAIYEYILVFDGNTSVIKQEGADERTIFGLPKQTQFITLTAKPDSSNNRKLDLYASFDNSDLILIGNTTISFRYFTFEFIDMSGYLMVS